MSKGSYTVVTSFRGSFLLIDISPNLISNSKMHMLFLYVSGWKELKVNSIDFFFLTVMIFQLVNHLNSMFH